MAETLIFEEQITLTPLEINGEIIPYYEIVPPSFTLEVGQNYRIVLDTSEFSVTAYDMGGSAVIGNAALGNVVFGDSVDTGEPFVIAHALANGEDVVNDSIIFVVNNGNTSPTVVIYHIEGEPDGIVIRDPLGKVVTYGDYKKIRINKSSGEKVIYSEGEAVEDVEIALDFSDGDQTITATDGTLVKSAVIKKPETLLPENIAKDVDIAGVVGTLESGGGGAAASGNLVPAILLTQGGKIYRGYYSSATSSGITAYAYLPLNSVIHGCVNLYQTIYNSNATAMSGSSMLSIGQITPTITASDTVLTVSYKRTLSLRNYFAYITIIQVLYSVPGLYIKTNADGSCEMYADETCTVLSVSSSNPVYPTQQISMADLSNGTFTTLPNGMFNQVSVDCEILLPATVQSIESNSLGSSNIKTVDLSRCTSIPTLANSHCIALGTEIRVPAALYEEWIAASNWSTLADSIVAV